MTTDPFTEAARDHAEVRCTISPSTRIGANLWSTRQMRDFGVVMAEWARTYLAEQEATDAEVEAAAKAQYRNPEGWDLMLAAYRERVAEAGPIPTHVIAHRLELARDALRAARAVGRDAR